jgi:inorganic pyrophosphatase
MSTKSMASPARLRSFDLKKELAQVTAETPAGSRKKFAYDARQGISSVKEVLPAGMTFPYDFGFGPQTLAANGDPIDSLLLMAEPAHPSERAGAADRG